MQDNDDLVHDISSETDNEDSDSESTGDEECNNLVGFTQTARFSKMVLKVSISHLQVLVL